MENKNILESGWSIDVYGSSVYHFNHILKKDADELLKVATGCHVVETINLTLAGKEKPYWVHHNLYFATSLAKAVGLAAQITIQSLDVAEEVICIRPATEDEVEQYFRVFEYFDSKIPAGISDHQVKARHRQNE